MNTLNSYTSDDIKTKQSREAEAVKLEQRKQIEREAAYFMLTSPKAPEQRKDTTGSLFDSPSYRDLNNTQPAVMVEQYNSADLLATSTEQAPPTFSNYLTATYSPEDNKLRLYSMRRLDSDTYQAVKAAGFIYASKQDLFVAPSWTPQREDLLLSLCGEIGDEETSLIDRAENRADRFGDYSSNRAADSESARRGVRAIADNIPFGQPILVGHHSERHARRDAERIHNGMNKTVRMWEQSEYWSRRANAVMNHAEYKQRPDVRARRIKTLEAELRGLERDLEDSTIPQLNLCRWIDHTKNRISYEKALLAAQGGLPADQFTFEIGGQVRVRGRWELIKRINKKDGQVVSVSGFDKYAGAFPLDEIQDYKAPSAELAKAAKALAKPAKLTNYPNKDGAEMTLNEWEKVSADYKGYTEVAANDNTERHRVRHVLGAFLDRQKYPHLARHEYHSVYISDMKTTQAPKKSI